MIKPSIKTMLNIGQDLGHEEVKDFFFSVDLYAEQHKEFTGNNGKKQGSLI